MSIEDNKEYQEYQKSLDKRAALSCSAPAAGSVTLTVDELRCIELSLIFADGQSMIEPEHVDMIDALLSKIKTAQNDTGQPRRK
jgi:hypothetical protein